MKKYDSNNVFAKILKGEIPCKKFYEDDEYDYYIDEGHIPPK